MYFCPNCSYILDITKSSSNIVSTNKNNINKVSDLFKLIDKNEKIENYNINFTHEELIKHHKYKDYKDKLNNINDLFDNKLNYGAQFICNNCNYNKNITETTLLYQLITEEKNNKIFNIEYNKLLANDPLLPHTKDYTCKNSVCDTHTNKSIKDAVFYKENNTYKVTYICTVCNYSW